MPVVSSVRVKVAVAVWALPLPRLVVALVLFRLIERMLLAARVLSSLLWLMPSWLRSRQTRTSAKRVSLASNMSSSLLSRSDRASKPSVAFVPSAFTVSTPNSSPPLSIVPLLFRSSTSQPSSGLSQPVPVLTPSLLWSNTTRPSAPRVSMPSPSRSSASGSRRGNTQLLARFHNSFILLGLSKSE